MILIAILFALVMFVLLPLLFVNVMAAALIKLYLQPQTALLLVMAIMFGGLINISIHRIRRTELVRVNPLAVFGFSRILPTWWRVKQDTVIAVNVGGCIIPLSLAVYEIVHLYQAAGIAGAFAVFSASALNIVACFFLAKPEPKIGIMMPAFIPALVAAISAYWLLPELAPPVAFVAGVLGPIVGADLLHLRTFTRTSTGVASIGGAGTFDGIVLSGIVAAYLA